MTLPTEQNIWPVPDGITDLPDNWRDLAVPTVKDIAEVWKAAHAKLQNAGYVKDFNERLKREWAIETGVIEDVFHIDRGVTLNLIEHGISSALLVHGSINKPAGYVIDILKDHLDALEWLFDVFITQRRELTVGAVKNLHALLTHHQLYVDAQDPEGRPMQLKLISGDWKNDPNNVSRDSVLYRYCPPLQVPGQMEALVRFHLEHEAAGIPPDVQAAWLHHRFTQIHPFQDGNGRVARALATMVFLKAGLFPLVVTRDDYPNYIEALESADNGDLGPLARAFAAAEQARFDAALNVAEALGRGPTAAERAIEALKTRFERSIEGAAVRDRPIYVLSRGLEQFAVERLAEFQGKLRPIKAIMARQRDDASDDYRWHAAEAARRLNYVADVARYHAWVSLIIDAGPEAELALFFHPRGIKVEGVMACLPVLLGHGHAQPDGHIGYSLVPVADGPFEFYGTENLEAVKVRFSRWLDEVVALAVSQYQRML
jgi:Fic family protein